MNSTMDGKLCVEACSEEDPGAFRKTLDQLEGQGQAPVQLPCLTRAMVADVMSHACKSVSNEQLQKHLSFMKEFGKMGTSER